MLTRLSDTSPFPYLGLPCPLRLPGRPDAATWTYSWLIENSLAEVTLLHPGPTWNGTPASTGLCPRTQLSTEGGGATTSLSQGVDFQWSRV